MSVFAIYAEFCGVEIHIIPERDTRYEVHKAAYYPFRCVAEDVIRYMKRIEGFKFYVKEEFI